VSLIPVNKLPLQELNQLIGIDADFSFFQKYLVLNHNFQGGKCQFFTSAADAHAIIDYFISGSTNKASSSNETKKRF